MRRVLGVVLVTLGVLALVGGAVLKWVIAPNVVKAPVDAREGSGAYAVETVATGQGNLLDQQRGVPLSGLDVRAVREVRADRGASTDDIAVWDVTVTTTAGPAETEVSTTTDRVAFDRTTSVAVSGYDESVDGEAVSHEGTISYKFPFDAQKQTYDYFDTTTGEGHPAEYVGTGTVNGLDVYEYQQTIEPTSIGSVTLPGALLRLSVPSVELDRQYAVTRSFFVEPVTGVIVRGTENTAQTLELASAGVSIPAFSAELAFDEDTVNDRVDEAKDAKAQITLVERTLPLVGLVVGVVLLALGLVLLLTGRSRREALPAAYGDTAGPSDTTGAAPAEVTPVGTPAGTAAEPPSGAAAEPDMPPSAVPPAGQAAPGEGTVDPNRP